ncbi:MAG: MgtC/SapB family protein [Thermoleophilia bacterium]
MEMVLVMTSRVLLALALGGAIGLERELRERAAGFRTHILVAVGAAAFTLASVYGFQQFLQETAPSDYRFDPSRVAAQIVSGIGFLGAGAIIRHGVSVRGLTTAASLWAAAAIGMLSGLGMYGLAVSTTAIVVLSLAGLRFVEGFVLPRSRDELRFFVRFDSREYGHLSRVIDTLDERHVRVRQLQTDPEEEEARLIHLDVRLPEGMTANQLFGLLGELPGVVDVNRE